MGRARAKVKANQIEEKKEKKEEKKPRISVSVSSSVSQSAPRKVNRTESGAQKTAPKKEPTEVSDLAKKEEEANRRVAELTNNILELKAKLEQLRLELEV